MTFFFCGGGGGGGTALTSQCVGSDNHVFLEHLSRTKTLHNQEVDTVMMNICWIYRLVRYELMVPTQSLVEII
jgi:hypothetical protein